MSEHVHLEATKGPHSARFTVRTVVRRKFAEAELEIERGLGYEIEARYCGDPLCLGPEPTPRYTA